MCRPWKWFWGLVPLTLVFLAALLLKTKGIEQDLTTRTNAALKAANAPWASVAISGRDAQLIGTAPTADDREKAQREADRVAGVRTVNSKTDLLPEQKPYTFALKREGSSVTVSGFAPNSSVKGKVLDALKTVLPGIAVSDDLKLGAGAPDEKVWLAITKYATEQLALLQSGTAAISDTQLTLSGQASDLASFDKFKAALAKIPDGYKVIATDVTAPKVSPFTFVGAFDGKSLALSGYIPSDDVRKSIVSSVAKVLANVQVNDTLKVASGASPRFEAAVNYGLSLLSRLTAGKIEMSDNALSVYGQARSSDDLNALMADLKNLPQGVALKVSDIKAPVVVNYAWNASYDGKTIILNGFVPSDEVRRMVLDAAIAGAGNGVMVTDNMKIADGAPAHFADTVKYSLAQLGRMASGKAILDSNKLSFDGVAKTSDSYLQARMQWRVGRPDAVDPGSFALKLPTVSPYRFSATLDGKGVTLKGLVPSEDVRSAILQETRRLFSSTINESLALALGAPEGFEDAAKVGLQQLAKLKFGQATLVDDGFSIEGEASSSSSLDAAKALSRQLPRYVNLKLETLKLQAAPAAAPVVSFAPNNCQAMFNNALQSGEVVFERNTAHLDMSGTSVLDKVVEAARRCVAVKFEIGGHTDPRGGDGINVPLSQSRANAVMEYLKGRGIDPARMTAVGYGSKKQISPNDTPENRAKNRRIEIIVK